MRDPGELIDRSVTEIRALTDRLVVAFSGGEDSTLVALLAREALGKDNVKLINVCFGPYSYSAGLEIVASLAAKLGLRLEFTPGYEEQEKIWRHGPSCNRCTRLAKFSSIRKATTALIATGANQSDTWGQTGIALRKGLYSPIRDWTKEEIKKALEFFGVEVPRIGEAPVREGCKLKHLLKMMTNPGYHGYAVAVGNEVLLDNLGDRKHELVNVKIIGPLSKNIALVNVRPLPPEDVIQKITERLTHIDAIDEVHWVRRPITLIVTANPGVFGARNSRKWIQEGRLQPEMAEKIEIKWIKSKNRRLATFQVVDFEETEVL